MAEDRITLTSPSGVKIVFQPLKPSEGMRIVEAGGGSNAGNQRWMMLAMAVGSVRQIGDLPILFPKDKAEIEAIADRLGDGYSTVLNYSFGTDETPVQAEDAMVEIAKN